MVAHADVRCLQVRSVNGPSIRTLFQAASPEERASLALQGIGTPVTTRLSIRGAKLRFDVGTVSTLMTPGPVTSTAKAISSDDASKTMGYYRTRVDRTTHQFESQPYVFTGVYGSSASTPVGQSTCDVQDTGEKKTLFGHPCRRYHFVLSLPGQGLTGDGTVWAAIDLAPALACPDERSPTAVVEQQLAKVPGLVLIAAIQLTGQSGGDISLDIETKRLSNAPLPLTTFVIPSGFVPTKKDVKNIPIGS